MWSMFCWSFFSPLIKRRILLLALSFIECKGRWYHLLSLFNKRRNDNNFFHVIVATTFLCTCLPTDFFTQIWSPVKKYISESHASSMFSIHILSFTPQFSRKRPWVPSKNIGRLWGHIVVLSSFEISNEILRFDISYH